MERESFGQAPAHKARDGTDASGMVEAMVSVALGEGLKRAESADDVLGADPSVSEGGVRPTAQSDAVFGTLHQEGLRLSSTASTGGSGRSSRVNPDGGWDGPVGMGLLGGRAATRADWT